MAHPPSRHATTTDPAAALPPRIKRGLGWVRDLPDPRDHLYSAPMAALRALPDKVDLTPAFPCYDQGDIGSCTANALAGAVQFDRVKAKQKPAFIPSRLFIYYNERKVEGAIGSDAGARLRDGIRVLQKLGVCPEAEWSYDDTPAEYEGGPFPPGAKPAEQPPAAAYADAKNYLITSYQRVTQTLSQLQGCLAAGHPFVFGFTVFKSWYAAHPRPVVIGLPTAHDTAIGGHAVMCVGYDNARSMFRIRNSWGTAVGQHGYFDMPYEYLTSTGLSSDVWVINAVKD